MYTRAQRIEAPQIGIRTVHVETDSGRVLINPVRERFSMEFAITLALDFMYPPAQNIII